MSFRFYAVKHPVRIKEALLVLFTDLLSFEKWIEPTCQRFRSIVHVLDRSWWRRNRLRLRSPDRWWWAKYRVESPFGSLSNDCCSCNRMTVSQARGIGQLIFTRGSKNNTRKISNAKRCQCTQKLTSEKKPTEHRPMLKLIALLNGPDEG